MKKYYITTIQPKNNLWFILVFFIVLSCDTAKVPVTKLKREIISIPNKIIGWEYYVELKNGSIKSESIYNSNNELDDDALDKAIEAIHLYAKNDSLIKRKVLKPILGLPYETTTVISSF